MSILDFKNRRPIVFGAAASDGYHNAGNGDVILNCEQPGSYIVVFISGQRNSATDLHEVTDDGGNLYEHLFTNDINRSDGAYAERVHCWITKNTSGQTTLDINASLNTDYPSIFALEIKNRSIQIVGPFVHNQRTSGDPTGDTIISHGVGAIVGFYQPGESSSTSQTYTSNSDRITARTEITNGAKWTGSLFTMPTYSHCGNRIEWTSSPSVNDKRISMFYIEDAEFTPLPFGQAGPSVISVPVSLITENETLFSITAVPGAASDAPGLITENESLFGVSPIPSIGIAPALILENETLFTVAALPGVAGDTPGLVTENETLAAVTALPGVASDQAGLITENETLFGPDVIQGPASDQPGLVTENESLFAVSPVASIEVIPGLITENETLFSPAVAASIDIALAIITENESLFSPGAIPGVSPIEPGLITENESLFAVSPTISASTALITELETLFGPTAVATIAIAPGLITENDIMGDVVVTGGAAGVVTVIAENESLFGVTAVPGAFTVVIGQILENETLFGPDAAPIFSATPGLVTENESLFGVTPSTTVLVAPSLITENETLIAVSPSQVGSAPVGLLTELETLYALAVVADFGGIYNAAAYFGTGKSVTIALYDPVTGSAIALDSNVCTEINSTGLYIWSAGNMTTQPTEYQEYAWVMTDGTDNFGGILQMGDSDRLVRIEKLVRNKRITNPVTGTQQIYDDDNSTVLFEGSIYEDADGTTSYSSTSTGIDRADRLDDA